MRVILLPKQTPLDAYPSTVHWPVHIATALVAYLF